MPAVRAPALLLAACVASCGAAAWLISVDQEIAIGREAQREVKKEVPPLDDRAAAAYVSRLGARLAARAGGPRYPYSFTIADHRDLNAFALPGGPVWVHRGIIEAAEHEAQLAGVLAHEIAHLARRHAAEQMTKTLVANGLLGLLGAMLGNEGAARTARLGAQVLAGGYLLKFSRDDEREADRAGVEIMHRAGFDASGMLEFLRALQRVQGRNPGVVATFLSTHPAPAERVDLLRAAVRGKTGGRRDSAEFRSVRARLRGR